jgi:hypothetical protein
MTPLLPADGCPSCLAASRSAVAHPSSVQIDGSGVLAWYRCPSCGHRWRTWWALEALELPCPGCPLCNPLSTAGDAA